MEYSIRLNAVNNQEKGVRAFATVVFGDSFKVTNVAVVEGSRGTFVSMPSFRTKERDEHNNPVYKDVCNPITMSAKQTFGVTVKSCTGILYTDCRFHRQSVSRQPQPQSGKIPYAAVRIRFIQAADLSDAQYKAL